MPIYNYKCEACSNAFERIQSINDEPIKECPECNRPTVYRVIGNVGVIFNGDGFVGGNLI